MLAEILTAIELIVSTVRRKKSPEARRRTIAKGLFAIHKDLCDVVCRGRELIYLMGTPTQRGIGPAVQLSLLVQQKEAIGKLLSDLQAGPFDLASLHLPKMQHLLFLTNVKAGSVDFYISQFIDGTEHITQVGYLASLFSHLANSVFLFKKPFTPERAATIIEEIGNRRMMEEAVTSGDMMKVLLSVLGSPRRKKGVTDRDVNDALAVVLYYKVQSDIGIQHYRDSYGLFRLSGDPDDVVVGMHGTSDDLAKAEALLGRLDELSNELRAFLVNTFQIEELA